MTRRAPRGEPRCYTRVDDELTVSDEFVDRILQKTLDDLDASLIWRAMGAFRGDGEDSLMQVQALQDLGQRLRARLCAALAQEIGCLHLHSRLNWRGIDETARWKLIERHVSECPDCSVHESEAIRLLRSPALARRVLEEVVSAFQRPQQGTRDSTWHITPRRYPPSTASRQGDRQT